MQRLLHIRHTVFVLVAVAFCLIVSACASPRNTPSLPPVNLGVAWFTQPAQTAELLAGFLPANTDRVTSKNLLSLDMELADTLRAQTKREYSFSTEFSQCADVTVPGRTSSSRGAALHYWTAVGKCMKVDYLIVPQIILMKERDGSDIGAVSPSSVIMETFLIDVRENRLAGRSHFDETQAALSANLLDTDKFISRGGRWITALELAREGMNKAVVELGL